MGTHDELMSKGLNFATLIAAHGIGAEEDEEDDAAASGSGADGTDGRKKKSWDGGRKKSVDGGGGGDNINKKKKDDDAMMGAEEERSVGNVGSKVYIALFKATGSLASIPVVALLFGSEYGTKAFSTTFCRGGRAISSAGRATITSPYSPSSSSTAVIYFPIARLVFSSSVPRRTCTIRC